MCSCFLHFLYYFPPTAHKNRDGKKREGREARRQPAKDMLCFFCKIQVRGISSNVGKNMYFGELLLRMRTSAMFSFF